MGTRSGYHRRTHLDGLTGRQREVLEQMAQGKTNLEIAESLGIGFESVKSHVSDILLRLDVSSREEAIEAWQGQGGAISRLRRTATGFVLTGFGKAATAGVAALLAAGVGFAIFAMAGGGDSSVDGRVDTYLLDDGREVNQAFVEVEANDRVAFDLVHPAGSDWRVGQVDYWPTNAALIIGGERSLGMTLRDPDGRFVWVRQRNTEEDTMFRRTDPTRSEHPVNSGRPGIEVVLYTSETGYRYDAWGFGRGFEVTDPAKQMDNDEAIDLILALFDAAPGPLPSPEPGRPNPAYTRVVDPVPAPQHEIVLSMTAGTDFFFKDGSVEEVRQAASKEAGFEIALPSTLPAGASLSRIRIPNAKADPAKRSAYVSMLNEEWLVGLAVMQHDYEVLPPGEWGRRVDSGSALVEAWEIGDFRNSERTGKTFMAVGNGRTAAILVIRSREQDGTFREFDLEDDEAIALLVSKIEAVP